jgi:hypothetical protein
VGSGCAGATRAGPGNRRQPDRKCRSSGPEGTCRVPGATAQPWKGVRRCGVIGLRSCSCASRRAPASAFPSRSLADHRVTGTRSARGMALRPRAAKTARRATTNMMVGSTGSFLSMADPGDPFGNRCLSNRCRRRVTRYRLGNRRGPGRGSRFAGDERGPRWSTRVVHCTSGCRHTSRSGNDLLTGADSRMRSVSRGRVRTRASATALRRGTRRWRGTGRRGRRPRRRSSLPRPPRPPAGRSSRRRPRRHRRRCPPRGPDGGPSPRRRPG